MVAALGGNNPINDYYEYLLKEKNYPPYHARHKACRRLATLSFGVLKSGKSLLSTWRHTFGQNCMPLFRMRRANIFLAYI